MPPTVLITGCSPGGIGSALVEEFHLKGAHVYATARSKDKLRHLEHLPNVSLLELDVVSQASIESAVEAVRTQSGGKLDVLINNAGQSLVMPALDTSLEDAKQLFDVNVFGAFAVTKGFMDLLVEAQGVVVNVCSISGVLNAPWMAVYNASKSALMTWSETLRLEVAPFNVRVISLVTGAIDTKLMSHAKINLPPDSVYVPAIDEIRNRGIGADVTNKSDPGDFARDVVHDVLAGAQGPVWRGAMSGMVRFMYRFGPAWLVDFAMRRGTGIDRLG
ncbi:NAD(P)-binding protein [Aspergillus californicus]